MALIGFLTIAGTQEDDRVCPRIFFHDVDPTEFQQSNNDPNIFYKLERYTVLKEQVMLNKLQHAILMQRVAQPLSVYDTSNKQNYVNISMNLTTPMSNDVLGKPEYLDIENIFSSGQYQYYTDRADTVDIDAFQYVYRARYQIRNDDNTYTEYATNYVYGVTDSMFVDTGLVISGKDDTSLFENSGTLYSRTKDGIIVIKGMPTQVFSRRYRGPIECEKESAARMQLAVNNQFIRSSIETLSASVRKILDDLITIGKDR